MKKVLKQSMEIILVKHLMEFTREPNKDLSTIKHYAETFTNEYEKYLMAYNEFKED